jgi:hypothetical protein
MYRIQINISYKKVCVKLVIYQDYTKIHGPGRRWTPLISCHVSFHTFKQ